MREYKESNEKQYAEDLKYWCNSCGELHHWGQYDITEEELPEDLRIAYNTLWEEGTGSYCYLVTYLGKNYVALINEYDDNYAETINVKMDQVYQMAKDVVTDIESEQIFKDTQVILAKQPEMLCYEVVVLLNPDDSKEHFNMITSWLRENAYREEAHLEAIGAISYERILELLPKDATSSIWTNGEDILCKTAESAETIADFLENLGVLTDSCTGYFDPVEDQYNNETDECSGWYYVH